jgi:hypothetical protein
MLKNQKIYLVLASIVVAAFVVWLANTFFQIKYITDYIQFLANTDNINQLLTNDWIRNLTLVGVVFLGIILYYLVISIFVFTCLSMLYVIFASKWKKPTIFISYKHADADAKVNTDKIATDMKTALEQQGFRINFFQFDPNASHDQVNHQIRELLRSCDMMIVVPDPYKPSYVNTEIQGAALAEKPLFIIKHTKDQRLPDTANSGHPVILYQKLDKKTFSPLPQIILHVCRHWSVQWQLILKSLSEPLEKSDNIDLFSDGSRWIFTGVALLLVKLSVSSTIILGILQGIVLGIIAYCAYIFISKIAQYIDLNNAARQSILTGGDTNATFAEVFEDNESVMACLDTFKGV